MPDAQPIPPAANKALAAAASARNLQQRVVSGIAMAMVSVALIYAGPLPFTLLILAVAIVMCWEWGHLVRSTAADAAFGLHAVSVGVAIGLTASGLPALALAALMIGMAAMVPLTLSKRPVLSALGVPYVGLAAIALIWIRQDQIHGFAAILFLLLVVTTTDTMAFVFGRTIGGAKLWPSVSPNKTWAGFLGGVGSSAVVSAMATYFIAGASPVRLAVLGLVLGIIAQGGDLAESALKRFLGVKDASAIIPGHGGVMDRMDGVVTVAMAAALFALIWKANAPAAALLIGD